MSYFLAGRFHFSGPLSQPEQTELSFILSEKALHSRVALQLGCNIVKPLVHQILGEHGGLGGEAMFTFLLTGSPITNISDDILTYWANSIGESVDKIRSNSRQIVSFLKSIQETNSIAAVTLVVSEGYDTSYRAEAIPLDRLQDRFVELAAEYDWSGFPSVMLTVPLHV